MKLFVDTSISAELSKISVTSGGAHAPFKGAGRTHIFCNSSMD